MFSGFTDDTIRFFLDIRFHNEPGYVPSHRAEYEHAVRDPFYSLIDDLAPHMLKIDPDFEVRPVKCLSRINRDTRFSRDKSPYRDHLWLAFRKAAVDKQGMPFFWFELSPENTLWGVGIWGENRPMMDVLRRRMAAKPDDYLPIIDLLGKARFGLGGAEFKRLEVPPGIPEPLIPIYKKREIYFEKLNPKMEWVFSEDLVTRLLKDFKRLAPVYRILRGCEEEAFEMMQVDRMDK